MNQDNSDLAYWLAFARLQKIGPIKFQKIVNYFGDLKLAWEAGIQEYVRAGLEENLATEIQIAKTQIKPEAELEIIKKEGIKIARIIDEDYPKSLKEIYNPPPILFYRGSLEPTKGFCLAVVGTRKYSAYGRQVTEDIVSELSTRKITIVSGLALGIDALAHEACLKAKGQTIAVLGSGLDRANIYPSANRYLANKIIASGGAVVSEYPAGTMPAKFTFPQRNRIISGLSLGTIVIEAPESSGALITAKFALEQNREVFAVPGSIYSPSAKGANNLIKQGAKMVLSASDILEELNLLETASFIAAKEIMPENAEEEIISKIITKEPTHIDKIIQLSKLKVNVLSSILVMMEMKGMIKDIGGKNYILTR